jgi:hypothetical protein
VRSVTAVPRNQPDALEWVNNGGVRFVLSPSTHEVVVLCNEVEFGTWSSVTGNRARAAVWCAEGDSCLQRTETAVLLVPLSHIPLQEPILTSHVAHTTTKARSRIAPARGHDKRGFLCIYNGNAIGVKTPPNVESFEDTFPRAGSGPFGFDMEWTLTEPEGFDIGA